MRRFLLSTASIIALALPALAADLPSTKSAPLYTPPAPIFTWTGFYLGVEGGGDFRQYKDGFGGYTVDKDAGLIGGVLGYNWQVSNFILGLEGDAAGVLGGNKAFTPNGVAIYNNSFNSNYAAAIRGRVGIPVFDRALLYVAGGVAFGDTKTGFSTTGIAAQSYTTSRTGWTIGGGVDYAFTDNWIGRIEYRYVDLGKGGYYNYGRYLNDGVSVNSSQVLLALMYKFGAPQAPVLGAKY